MTLLLSKTHVDAIVAQKRPGIYRELIDRVKAGYGELVNGTADMHPRVYLRPRNDSRRRPPGMFSMSALLAEEGRMGTRLLALGGSGPAHGGDGLLVLFDQRTMECLSIMNDQAVHMMRTGAPAGVATELLARKDVKTIGVIGSSMIAEGGLLMSYHARPGTTAVRVFSPTQANREKFAVKMTAELGIPVTAVGTPEEAVHGADLVVTATDLDRPVVPPDAISPGTHFNCMSRNELEMETYRSGRVFLSSTELHKIHDPPFSPPLPHEAVFGDLIDLTAGKVAGRRSDDDITIYAASGPLATWDVATASVIYDNAVALKIGQEISLW